MKILVCTDGSKHSEKVIEEACRVAGNMKIVDDITVIHTYKRKYTNAAWTVSKSEPEDKTAEEVEEMRKHLRELDEKEFAERKKVLEVAAEFFKKNTTAEVHTLLKEGHPARTICEAALSGGFDLVVVGSRGRSGLWGVFLGSVSNAVVQNCEKNVLVVK